MNKRKFTKKEIFEIAKQQGRKHDTFEPEEYVCPECEETQILDAWEVAVIESNLVNSRYLCNKCYEKNKGGKI